MELDETWLKHIYVRRMAAGNLQANMRVQAQTRIWAAASAQQSSMLKAVVHAKGQIFWMPASESNILVT